MGYLNNGLGLMSLQRQVFTHITSPPCRIVFELGIHRPLDSTAASATSTKTLQPFPLLSYSPLTAAVMRWLAAWGYNQITATAASGAR